MVRTTSFPIGGVSVPIKHVPKSKIAKDAHARVKRYGQIAVLFRSAELSAELGTGPEGEREFGGIIYTQDEQSLQFQRTG